MNHSADNRTRVPARANVSDNRVDLARRRRSGTNIDFVKLALHNAWWLLLGLVFGLGAGYLQYRQSAAMFRSSAKVQIIESSAKNLPVDDLEGGSTTRALSDEALVMRSEHILTHAAELAKLSTTPEFSERTPEQIAGMLAGSKSLVVEPAVESGDTSVFQIQYDSTGAETSRLVVQGIVDAYASHLQDQYHNVGQETIELIQSARVDVLEKLTTLEEQFAEFKKQSGLTFRDNATTSVHHDNADNYLKQQQALMIQHAQLSSVLAATQLAVEQGRPTEAVLLGLTLSSQSPALKQGQQDVANRNRDREIQRIRDGAQLTASQRMRQEKLLPLRIERQQLQSSVGLDHPALATLDQRIAVIQATIDEIARSEERLQDRLDAVWENVDKSGAADENADPEKRLRESLEIGIFALRQRQQAVEEEAKIVGEAYRSEMETAKMESVKASRSAQFVREIARQQELYDRIMERLDEVNLMSDGPGLQVFPLDKAKAGYRFAPSLIKSLLMGGFLGCLLAAGLVFLREISDRSYHSPLEIAEHTSLPVIGHVPDLTAKTSNREPYDSGLDPRLCTALNSKGREAESFRAIRTAIFFSNQAGDNQVLQVTSATPGDGKSTIAANLAIAIAQSGRSVLLMDADLRRHRVHKLFGMECQKGLAWAIDQVSVTNHDAAQSSSSELVYREAIRETVIPNLSVMLAGDRPENPAELLSSASFERLLESLRCKFDMILIDTPPLLAVSDPSNVVQRADGILFVVRLRKNIKPVVARATRMLETLDANVLGVVVNGLGSHQARGYGNTSDSDSQSQGKLFKYGYGYSYGCTSNGEYSEYYDDEDSRTRSKRRRPLTPLS